MDFQETEWEGVDWIHLLKNRDQWWSRYIYGNEPLGSTKCKEFLDQMKL